MDNQLIIPKNLTRQIVIIIMAIILSIFIIVYGISYYRMSDPYIHEVLSHSGNINQGNAIFQINCAGCHGIEGKGNVGPSLTHIAKYKSKYNLIKQVISGKTPPMPKFQPTYQEMADLLSYLEQL